MKKVLVYSLVFVFVAGLSALSVSGQEKATEKKETKTEMKAEAKNDTAKKAECLKKDAEKKECKKGTAKAKEEKKCKGDTTKKAPEK